MRLFGFAVFVIGLVLHLWCVVVLGFALYELPGVTWLAAMMANHNNGSGFHNDQGPLN